MTDVPAMRPNVGTSVGVPSNPALAFSAVTHEATPSPALVPIEVVYCSDPTVAPIGPVCNSDPVVTPEPACISASVSGLAAMSPNVSAQSVVPTNPADAFSEPIHEEVPDPVVVPKGPVYRSEPVSINKPRPGPRRPHPHDSHS